MTDDRDESNVRSIDERRKKVKQKHLRDQTPATKGDLEVLVNKIIELEDELDRVSKLLVKTLRLIKELSNDS